MQSAVESREVNEEQENDEKREEIHEEVKEEQEEEKQETDDPYGVSTGLSALCWYGLPFENTRVVVLTSTTNRTTYRYTT